MTLAVLVTGARGPRKNSPGWTDRAAVWSYLDKIGPDSLIVGDADGVDHFARTWARFRQMGNRLHVFDAQWTKKGRGAGPYRNREMAKALRGLELMRCEVRVVGFHDDILNSRGTRDMLTVAHGYSFRRTLVFHVGTPSASVQRGQL